MVKVKTSPIVLEWAAKRSGRLDEVELKFPKYTQWINNQDQPTLKQLESFAKYTYTPLGYLFLHQPPSDSLPIPHYRTLDDRQSLQPSPNLLETVYTMERRQEWIKEYLMSIIDEPLDFVGSAKKSDNIKDIASNIKRTLGLTDNWAAQCRTWEEALRYLLLKIEEVGIFVVVNGIVGNNTRRKLNVQEFRGFVLVDDIAPMIFINGADGKAAQMFTLAHEIAHIWFGKSAAFDLSALQPSDDEIEKKCNQVAAEFLVPETELISYWDLIKNSDDIYQKIAKYFKVSEIVAARRLLDLGIITLAQFFDFYNEKLKKDGENQNSSGGDFYRNQAIRLSRRFSRIVITAAKEGSLLYREAYKLTGLNDKTFPEFAKRLNSGGEL